MLRQNKKIRKFLKKKPYLIILGFLIIILVFVGGTVAGYLILKKGQNPQQTQEQVQKNIYAEFLSEVYDKIKENYWNKIGEEELALLFRLGAEKLTSAPQSLSSNDKTEVLFKFDITQSIDYYNDTVNY